MSFPNPDLGSFEGENNDWCEHVTAQFLRGVTSVVLCEPGADPAHAAYAHMAGAMFCAAAEGFSPELVEKLRYLFTEVVEKQNFSVEFPERLRPHLTILPGGKGPSCQD